MSVISRITSTAWLPLALLLGCKATEVNVPVFQNASTHALVYEQARTLSMPDSDLSASFWQQGDTLHLRLQSGSRFLAKSLNKGDLLIWLNEDGKKEHSCGLRFPGSMCHNNERGPARNSSRIFQDEMSQAAGILLSVEKNDPGTSIGASSALMSLSRFQWHTDYWSFELKLPLGQALITDHPFSVEQGDRLMLGLEERREQQSFAGRGGRKPENGGIRGGGGMQGVGRRGGGSGGRSGQPDAKNKPSLPDAVDVWILLNLQQSTQDDVSQNGFSFDLTGITAMLPASHL